MSDDIDKIKELVKIFRPERIIFGTFTVLSFIILISCAIIMIVQDSENIASIIGLFGSTGVITYTSSKILKMWSDSIDFINKNKNGTEK
jgi:hypothetical protein